jgi:hypothetical protein
MSSLSSVFGRRGRLVWRLLLLLALVALAALSLSGGSASLHTGVLMMLPALSLAVLMLTRPYLGERILTRLAARQSRRRAAGVTLPGVRAGMSVARGGRLIAVALAGRAPPLASPAATRSSAVRAPAA